MQASFKWIRINFALGCIIRSAGLLALVLPIPYLGVMSLAFYFGAAAYWYTHSGPGRTILAVAVVLDMLHTYFLSGLIVASPNLVTLRTLVFCVPSYWLLLQARASGASSLAAAARVGFAVSVIAAVFPVVANLVGVPSLKVSVLLAQLAKFTVYGPMAVYLFSAQDFPEAEGRTPGAGYAVGSAAALLALAFQYGSGSVFSFSLDKGLENLRIASIEKVYGGLDLSKKEHFARRCAEGDLNYCVLKGWSELYTSKEIALETFSKACAAGNGTACHWGDSSEPLRTEWDKHRCHKNGDLHACAYVARNLVRRPSQRAEALKYYRLGCLGPEHSRSVVCKSIDLEVPDGEKEHAREVSRRLYETDGNMTSLHSHTDELEGMSRPVFFEEYVRYADDGWGHQMRITQHGQSYYIESAGPDGRFETDDDFGTWTPFDTIYERYIIEPPTK